MDQAVGIANKSDSTIIVLLVVLALILIGLVPVIKVWAGITNDKKKQEYDREGRLIQVIEKNTEVNTALKTLIESDQKFCADCRNQQLDHFQQISKNQEITNIKLAEIQVCLQKEGSA